MSAAETPKPAEQLLLETLLAKRGAVFSLETKQHLDNWNKWVEIIRAQEVRTKQDCRDFLAAFVVLYFPAFVAQSRSESAALGAGCAQSLTTARDRAPPGSPLRNKLERVCAAVAALPPQSLFRVVLQTILVAARETGPGSPKAVLEIMHEAAKTIVPKTALEKSLWGDLIEALDRAAGRVERGVAPAVTAAMTVVQRGKKALAMDILTSLRADLARRSVIVTDQLQAGPASEPLLGVTEDRFQRSQERLVKLLIRGRNPRAFEKELRYVYRIETTLDVLARLARELAAAVVRLFC